MQVLEQMKVEENDKIILGTRDFSCSVRLGKLGAKEGEVRFN